MADGNDRVSAGADPEREPLVLPRRDSGAATLPALALDGACFAGWVHGPLPIPSLGRY
jgi:hypothetical protein